MFLPEQWFGYLADGHIDLWFKKSDGFSDKQKSFVVDSLEAAGYSTEIHTKKRGSELRFRIVELEDPSLLGRWTRKKKGAKVELDLFQYSSKRVHKFITSHELGHALGLAHQFDLPVTDTVMNYPSLAEINSTASLTLTAGDYQLASQFKTNLQNGFHDKQGDDTITGQHFCTGKCRNAFG